MTSPARCCRGWLSAVALAAMASWSHAFAATSAAIRVALPSDIRSTSPGVNRDSVTDWVMSHVVEGLVALDGSLQPAPMLAKSWNVSADGRDYTFYLRDGVRFHNGEILRAEHVVWSLRRMLDPKTRWACRSWFDGSGETGVRIESITAAEPATVVLRIDRPSVLFLYRLAHVPCLPAAIHPDSVDAEGRWVRPIGTGPYQLGAWRRGRYVELNRFDGYVPATGSTSGLAGRKDALAPALRFVIIPDPSAAKLAFLSGEVDIWPLTAAEAMPDLEHNAQVTLVTESTRDWAALLMQNSNDVLRDQAVRSAIANALDLDLIAKSTLHARVVPQSFAVRATSIDLAQLDYRRPTQQGARARVLQHAGYRGQLIEIDVNREVGTYLNDAIVMHSLLTRAGVNVRVRSMDWATLFKRYSQGDYQLSIFAFTGRAAAPMMYELFVCDKRTRANCVVDSPRALALLREMNAADSADAWPSLIADLDREIARDASIIGLYAPMRVTSMRKTVRGYATWALGTPRLWGVAIEPAS